MYTYTGRIQARSRLPILQKKKKKKKKSFYTYTLCLHRSRFMLQILLIVSIYIR